MMRAMRVEVSLFCVLLLFGSVCWVITRAYWYEPAALETIRWGMPAAYSAIALAVTFLNGAVLGDQLKILNQPRVHSKAVEQIRTLLGALVPRSLMMPPFDPSSAVRPRLMIFHYPLHDLEAELAAVRLREALSLAGWDVGALNIVTAPASEGPPDGVQWTAFRAPEDGSTVSQSEFDKQKAAIRTALSTLNEPVEVFQNGSNNGSHGHIVVGPAPKKRKTEFFDFKDEMARFDMKHPERQKLGRTGE